MATELHRTACPLDCPDTCSLAVEVTDGRLASIDGWPANRAGGNPLTHGLICGKVRRFAQHLDCPERLSTPLVRRGPKGAGEFEAVDWDTALSTIAERLGAIAAEHGPESILPVFYGGSNGLLTQDAADALFFRRLGAARLLPNLCAAPTGAALDGLYGKLPGVALEDIAHAKLIVVWGANPHSSGIHLVQRIDAAVAQGAKLVVVDPRRTPLAKRADLHLAARPGTDLPLALAVAGRIFELEREDRAFLDRHVTGVDAFREAAGAWSIDAAASECGVSADDLRAFVDLYLDTRPAVIRIGWGQERNRNGGFASAAIAALPAIAGHFGLRGGGFTASFSSAWKGRLGEACDEADRARREVNLNRVGRELCEPAGDPLRAVFVYNCNPLMTLPDQERVRRGLEREDLFTVVFDAVQTDTADYADVVLPATTFLEHRDLAKSYGSAALLEVNPVLDAHGSSRPNHDVFCELAERMGLLGEGERPSETELRHRILEPLVESGLDVEPLALDGYLPAPSGNRSVPFDDVFPNTPDRKIHLAPESFGPREGLYRYQPDPGTAEYPLALVSPSVARTITSTFGQLIQGQVPVSMHPDDAAARGLDGGDPVRVFNQLGEVRCAVKLDADLRPGLVQIQKGLWARHTQNGRTSNALSPDSLTDLGDGACFNDARVQVERA
ncbi:MAG: molybdopterin-dependent oxidoreductase [Planctomycetota bacterium]